MGEEKKESKNSGVIQLLKRGYFVFPMIDEGLKVELINSVNVEMAEEDVKKVIDNPEVIFKPFKNKTAGWAEFTSMYFLLPDLMLKAVKGMSEQYDYVVPIMATLGFNKDTVRVSFDCFRKL